jgi:putative transposase
MSKNDQKLLLLEEGQLIRHGASEYVITKIVDMSQVLARNLDTGKKEVLPIWGLAPALDVEEKDAKKEPVRDLEDVSEEDWEYAKSCLEIIKPLLVRQPRGSNPIDKIVQSSGFSRPTIYRWLRFYRNTGLLSSLLPTKRSGGRGRGRLSADIEAIIQDRVTNFYLTDQQPSIIATVREVRRLCSNAGLALPHELTIRKRIEWIEERERITKRRGRRAAIQRFEPNEGSVPESDWPLAMVQIDHTLVNVIVVHEETRKPINRPWITLAIDVYSRMIMGMYLTFDEPSAMSAGMCVSHAILPKEKWLADHDLDNLEWPCWGVMGTLHMDNAREFRGNMLKVACHEYGVDLMLRPVKTPRYGGHIERLMGTLSTELSTLPGATFSNPKQRGEYDSEAKAVMDINELERWLALFVAKYHNRLHTGIGMSPAQKYREGLLGGNGRPPRGLPARRMDDEKVRIDFMPIVERTIQPYGVVIDDIHYFADVLRPWVGVADPDNPKASRLFRFRRDPRGGQLYFFDPLSEHYFVIPYRDASLPPVSIHELRDARKAAKAAGYKDLDERKIFEFVNQQHEVVDQATDKTKSARVKHQKRIHNEKRLKKTAKDLPKTTATAQPAEPPVIPGYNPSPNQFFEDD